MAERAPADAAFDLLCLLVSSARGALEEGVYTASLRMTVAAEALASLASELPGDVDEARSAFLHETAASIREGSTASYLRGPDAYVEFLDDAVRRVGRELRRVHGLDTAP